MRKFTKYPKMAITCSVVPIDILDDNILSDIAQHSSNTRALQKLLNLYDNDNDYLWILDAFACNDNLPIEFELQLCNPNYSPIHSTLALYSTHVETLLKLCEIYLNPAVSEYKRDHMLQCINSNPNRPRDWLVRLAELMSKMGIIDSPWRRS